MSKNITLKSNNILRNVNLRPEVYDLIQGECLIRRNGGKGFSLTLNQIVLEYFDFRTPKNVAIAKELITDGTEIKPVLTIDWNPAKGEPL
jgi:hypothetical protein